MAARNLDLNGIQQEDESLLVAESFKGSAGDTSYFHPLNFKEKDKEITEANSDKAISKNERKYYTQQSEAISCYLNNHGRDAEAHAAKLNKAVDKAAKASFAANLVLLIAKAVAAGLSDSLAIISSVVDSAVDLISGFVLWYAGRKMKEADVHHYPQGRTRLEPLAIVILSCIMAMASVVLIREAIQNMAMNTVNPDVSIPTLTIIAGTVVIKAVLFVYCRHYKDSPSARTLAIDHRNDIVSNTLAAVFGALGEYVWVYADPIGAICISIYIFFGWWVTGSEQIKALTGHIAPPHIIRKLIWISLNHSEKIVKLDTVRAYRFGNNYLAEVDIVLNENIFLKEAHDIGEPLQRRLESLPEIERAFVHIDYEVDHRATDEHKQVWETLAAQA